MRLPLVLIGAAALGACATYPPVPKDAWPPAIPPPAASATKPAAPPSDVECHEYHEPVVIQGKLQEAYGTVCRQADGSWRITQKNDVAPPPEPAASEARGSPAPAAAAPAPSAAGSAATALAADARTHYDRAIEAQRAGDWAKYGEEIKALGEILKKMR